MLTTLLILVGWSILAVLAVGLLNLAKMWFEGRDRPS